MKKMFLAIAATALIGGQSLFAVLPPLYQGIDEVKAILDSSQIENYIGSHEVLENIINTKGGYLIVTSHSNIFVEVIYKDMGEMAGPSQFDLEFHRM
ncbi:MAG: hypothetical protein ACQEP8_00710 [Chlamydiota bacterium]